jgi:pimeloyl-ACP methyl ester carboxylesterase
MHNNLATITEAADSFAADLDRPARRPVIFCGFSIGGIVAQLCAAGSWRKLTCTGCYSFAAPAFGNAEMMRLVRERSNGNNVNVIALADHRLRLDARDPPCHDRRDLVLATVDRQGRLSLTPDPSSKFIFWQKLLCRLSAAWQKLGATVQLSPPGVALQYPTMQAYQKLLTEGL